MQEGLPGAIEAAFGAIAEIESLMSYHDRASDVSRLNRAAPGTAVAVHRHTWAVLAEAERISSASGGAFDITVAPELVRRALLPADGRPLPPVVARGFEAIELLSGCRVRITAPRWIDLGGIAKGYAVDVACDLLERAGIRAYVVNAGGDLRVGARAETIHVRDPREPRQLLPLIELADAAVATSARYVNRHDPAPDPIVAGATRAPAAERGSISVRARRCMTADALTKVVAVRGDGARPVLERFGADACVWSDGPWRARPAQRASRLTAQAVACRPRRSIAITATSNSRRATSAGSCGCRPSCC